MKPCIICKKDFKEEDMDFLGRCDQCFHFYMSLTDEQKEKLKGQLGVPYRPIYNGKAKYGF